MISGNILIYICLALAVVNGMIALGLWHVLRKARGRINVLQTATQRLDREMGQHRYALATLRQLHSEIRGNTGEVKTDQQLIDEAVDHLDEMAVQEAAELKPATKSISEASVKGLKDSEILQFIKTAVKDDALSLHQQPIVSLPSRETKYYEVFARLMSENGLIPAKNFVSVAKSNNLIAAIDNLLLLRCLQLLKKSPSSLDKEIFINISAQTFSSKKYMKELIDFLAANPKLSARLIFEMTQADSIGLTSLNKQVMEGLSLLGCRFSMDQVTILGMDMNRLMDQHISFVKLDAAALLKEMDNLSGRKRIKKIKNTLDSQGVIVILEKVENEKQLFSIIDLHADYGQGYLFGAPVPVR